MNAAHPDQYTLSRPHGGDGIAQPSTYTVDGRKFVVTPVFREDGKETFGTIFMRLLKAEAAAKQ